MRYKPKRRCPTCTGNLYEYEVDIEDVETDKAYLLYIEICSKCGTVNRKEEQPWRLVEI